MAKTYSELLRHPRWQEKRLEVMKRAGFKCEICGSQEETLHVHHGYYEKGKKPWEYPGCALHCICQLCHSEVTELINEIKCSIGSKSPAELFRILGYVKCFDSENHMFGLEIGGDEEVRGVADYFGTTPSDIVNRCQNDDAIGEIDGIGFWMVD